ncbi:hypothetical protein GF377_10655, partial [candidate division GN15 bacterium]|nr:hypothetical protein [candidate division GN15 bacterium]
MIQKLSLAVLVFGLLLIPGQAFAQMTNETILEDYFFINDWHSYDYA